jgi:hypothetical protein
MSNINMFLGAVAMLECFSIVLAARGRRANMHRGKSRLHVTSPQGLFDLSVFSNFICALLSDIMYSSKFMYNLWAPGLAYMLINLTKFGSLSMLLCSILVGLNYSKGTQYDTRPNYNSESLASCPFLVIISP